MTSQIVCQVNAMERKQLFPSCLIEMCRTFHAKATDLTLLTNMLELEPFITLQTVYAFFVGNTKRFAVLTDKLDSIENPVSLRNLSGTQWTARAESFCAMWVFYDGVLDVLQEISNSPFVDAKGQPFQLCW